jgi:hypothetical protein
MRAYMVTLVKRKRRAKRYTDTLMKKVIDYRNIHLAFLRVKNNYMNREVQSTQEIKLFEQCIPNIYEDIQLILKGKKEFNFKIFETLNKPKKKNDDGSWKVRPISKMNFLDSVVAQCIINILAEEIRDILPTSNFGNKLNKRYSENMYQFWKSGYSKFVNAEIESSKNKRYLYVIEADIENFYPSIDKDILIEEIKTVLSVNVEKETLFLKWLNKILDIKSINEDGEIISKGLPQGTLYSPLFAMFYTRDYLDNINLNYPNTQAFGYVDDIRIYCETITEAQEIIEELNLYMEKKKLQLNKDKSDIFPIDNKKRLETKIMGKASNLDRAIRDEIIISSKDKAEMRERLRLLIMELRELHEHDGNDKLEERLEKFVDYRIVKLLDENIEEWDKYLQDFINPDAIEGNFVAMWHALFVSCSSLSQKRNFIKTLEELLEVEGLEEVNYVKYIIYSYLFRWSPKELRYSNEDSYNIVKKHIIKQSSTYLKAALIHLHNEWIPYIKKGLNKNNSEDEEITSLLFILGLSNNLDEIYLRNINENRLYFEDDKLIHSNNTFSLNKEYLQSEKVKNIEYELYRNNNGVWSVTDETRGQLLTDLKLSEENRKYLLYNLCKWLDFQFQFSKERIPCSVIHPDYIYYDLKNKNIYIKGNPAFNNDIFYYDSPENLWRTSFASVIELLFNLDLGKGVNIFTDSQNLTTFTWQYRIINKLFHGYFNVKEFVHYVLDVINSDDSNSVVSYEQYKLNNLIRHYIKDYNHLDKLLLISIFVENSWKNGSKECNFFTLHNHEHGRYLIYQLHNVFDKADYSIYINSKEAFRLFSACFIHDLGMLSAPANSRLFDENKDDIRNLTKKVGKIIDTAKSRNLDISELVLDLPHIYDIYYEVEKLRDNIVRSEHPFVSEQEIVSDYPNLPLTVAERRDIGIISAAHGLYKSKVNNINNIIYDGLHPIRLKLLSLLLRLADLSDVSKERVRKEILERNHERMDKVSKYHWIKHLSVESLEIETIRSKDLNTPTKVVIYLNHNYLPSGNLEKEKLKSKCGNTCKMKLEDDGLEGEGQKGFFIEGKKHIKETNADFNYFKNNCNITCAFVNQSYNWFFAEVIYLNKYLIENNINIEFDLSIKKIEASTKDFHFVKNRNDTFSAQEFMINYFQ